jgi:hypothetical protein
MGVTTHHDLDPALEEIRGNEVFNLSLLFLLQGQSDRLSRVYRDVRDVLSPIDLCSGAVQSGDGNDGGGN